MTPILAPKLNGTGLHLIEPSKKVDFKVAVAICTHRDIKVRVFKQLRAIEKCPNPQINVFVLEGDALISRSRARVATTFLLETDYDYLFFVDDDVVWDTLDLTKMMWEAKHNNLDILGAAYSIKDTENPTFAVRTLGNGVFTFGEGGGLVEVRYVSTGCMLISRKLLQAMADSGQFHLCEQSHMKYYPFFDPMQFQMNGKWIHLSEDWAFCQRALDMGFKVWLDTTIKLGHVGPYTYDWDDFGREPKQKKDSVIYEVRVDE